MKNLTNQIGNRILEIGNKNYNEVQYKTTSNVIDQIIASMSHLIWDQTYRQVKTQIINNYIINKKIYLINEIK